MGWVGWGVRSVGDGHVWALRAAPSRGGPWARAFPRCFGAQQEPSRRVAAATVSAARRSRRSILNRGTGSLLGTRLPTHDGHTKEDKGEDGGGNETDDAARDHPFGLELRVAVQCFSSGDVGGTRAVQEARVAGRLGGARPLPGAFVVAAAVPETVVLEGSLCNLC